MTSLATHYVQFQCLPDGQISTGFLMGRLMHALHLTMVNCKTDDGHSPFGLTFPNHQSAPGPTEGPPIGHTIRMFARDEKSINDVTWAESMAGLTDYVHRTSVRPVGEVDRYAIYRRRQFIGSPEKLIRRAIKRHGLTETEAIKRYADYHPPKANLPFVQMRSDSSQKRFRLYIERTASPPTGQWQFTTYGLSTETALPEF